MFDKGRSGFAYPFRYLFTAVEGQGTGVSVLVTVPKRNQKRAVKRNLLKRRTREAFRTGSAPLRHVADGHGVHVNIALVYSTKEVVEFDKIRDAIEKILARICEGV